MEFYDASKNINEMKLTEVTGALIATEAKAKDVTIEVKRIFL